MALGQSLRDSGQLQEALAIQSETLEKARTHFGTEHVLTARTLFSLGITLIALRDLTGAIDMLAQARVSLDTALAVGPIPASLGTDELIRTLDITIDEFRAVALWRRGTHHDAISVQTSVVDKRMDCLESSPLAAWQSADRLALWELDDGDSEKSLSLYRRLFAQVDLTTVLGDHAIAPARAHLSRALWDSGDHRGALEHSALAIAACEVQADPEDPTEAEIARIRVHQLKQSGRERDAMDLEAQFHLLPPSE